MSAPDDPGSTPPAAEGERAAFERTQARVTAAALGGAPEAGFALAGAGAIRAHGVTDRPTEDVDLFTANVDATSFSAAVDDVIAALTAEGFEVTTVRRLDGFARLEVLDPSAATSTAGGRAARGGHVVDVDLGIDWRAYPPVTLDVGPVLAIEDAVGNKISALYSRSEVRDYLDVDAIRRSGRFSDKELLAAAAERDPGFAATEFANQLRGAQRIEPAAAAVYGVGATALAGIQERLSAWAAQLVEGGTPQQRPSAALREEAAGRLEAARRTAERTEAAAERTDTARRRRHVPRATERREGPAAGPRL